MGIHSIQLLVSTVYILRTGILMHYFSLLLQDYGSILDISTQDGGVDLNSILLQGYFLQ